MTQADGCSVMMIPAKEEKGEDGRTEMQENRETDRQTKQHDNSLAKCAQTDGLLMK